MQLVNWRSLLRKRLRSLLINKSSFTRLKCFKMIKDWMIMFIQMNKQFIFLVRLFSNKNSNHKLMLNLKTATTIIQIITIIITPTITIINNKISHLIWQTYWVLVEMFSHLMLVEIQVLSFQLLVKLFPEMLIWTVL